jgi:uncharacterized protein
MGNPVIRWQIVTPDPDASATFFHDLFGWSVQQDNAMGYREIRTGNGGIDGGMWPAPPQERPFVQLFVAVPDVEACVARASGLGATVVVPASTLPDGDTMAVILEPSGLSVGICKQRRVPAPEYEI